MKLKDVDVGKFFVLAGGNTICIVTYQIPEYKGSWVINLENGETIPFCDKLCIRSFDTYEQAEEFAVRQKE